LPVLHAALASALRVDLGSVLVTTSIEAVPPGTPQRFLVTVAQRGGRYPVLLSIYAAPSDRPSPDEARRILGEFAEAAGCICITSLEGMAEDEVLEIRGRDKARVVDADEADDIGDPS